MDRRIAAVAKLVQISFRILAKTCNTCSFSCAKKGRISWGFMVSKRDGFRIRWSGERLAFFAVFLDEPQKFLFWARAHLPLGNTCFGEVTCNAPWYKSLMLYKYLDFFFKLIFVYLLYLTVIKSMFVHVDLDLCY